MRPRPLAALWVVVAALAGLLLVYEIAFWRSLVAQASRADTERRRLSDEIKLREAQLLAEMRGNSLLLQEMQWTASGGDPAAYLTRVAELAREKRMKVLAIGPFERQSTPQFVKTWHAVQIQAPYREVRDLAARVEVEKGIVEDLRVLVAPTPAGSAPVEEVQASFKMAAVEISGGARQIVERAISAGRGTAAPPGGAALALPVPARAADLGQLQRDPFFFEALPAAARPGPRAAGPPPAERPAAPIELKGISNFPDGYLAIVNNQIVKVGDTVNGLRVEKITENAVTLREPGAATPQTVELPSLLGQPPPPPRR